MLTVNFIRQEKERVLKTLKGRRFADTEILDRILALDDRRRTIVKEMEQHQADSNKMSKEIGNLYKQGKKEEGDAQKSRAGELSTLADALRTALRETETEIESLLLQIPNCLSDLVPQGSSDADNEVFKAWDKPLPQLPQDALPHWELAKKYNFISFELGAKITGAGFPLYVNKGAKLQRALISFFLDEAQNAGYQEYITPLVVNKDSARGTGQLPDKDAQMYYIGLDELYLIPTAEVPLTNIYRDVILEESDLPIKLTGYTPCFRREAGAYGSHVRGLNRLHQFDKVEIVQLQHPSKSYEALTEMCNHVEGLLQKLELPYRILRLCSGDVGFASALTYDFETYSAAQQRWLEVSSVSNFESFQANRLNLRIRDGKNKMLAHTLNGSALALPRIVATLLENHQTPEGIRIPKALQPYLGGAELLF